MQEIWKAVPIEPYSDYYKVSNIGNVKRIKAFRTKNPIGYVKYYIGSHGYKTVYLSTPNAAKNFLVHRLVALAFIGKPAGRSQVNHIDGNKLNNQIDNLEWVTPSENIQHAYDTGLIDYYSKDHHFKTVYQFDKKGNLIGEFYNGMEAGRVLNISNASIYQCCIGMRHSAGGYLWSFERKVSAKPLKISPRHENGVNQYDLKGNFIAHFDTIKEAENGTPFSKTCIIDCCAGRKKTHRGYKWEYA